MEEPSKPTNLSYSYSQLLGNIYVTYNHSPVFIHLLLFKKASYLVTCVMNMIHMYNSNKLMQWKLGGYYITGTVLSYLHQTISNVSRYKLPFTAVYYYIQLVQVESQSKQGVHPNPLNPPWLCLCCNNEIYSVHKEITL